MVFSTDRPVLPVTLLLDPPTLLPQEEVPFRGSRYLTPVGSPDLTSAMRP